MVRLAPCPYPVHVYPLGFCLIADRPKGLSVSMAVCFFRLCNMPSFAFQKTAF